MSLGFALTLQSICRLGKLLHKQLLVFPLEFAERSHRSSMLTNSPGTTFPNSAFICSPQVLGYQLVMNRSPTDGSTRFSNTETIVGEGLTQAMIFNPLGAALSGLAVIVCLIASYHSKARTVNTVSLAFSRPSSLR